METACRICYENGDEPLRHPCRCRGSVGGVHASCLRQWIAYNGRERCEMCTTPYRFAGTGVSVESVADAQRICDSVIGNVGPHIVFQYGLVAVLMGHIGKTPIRLVDVCVLQAAYHSMFLVLMGRFIVQRTTCSFGVYARRFFNVERTLFMMLYVVMWVCLLQTGDITPLWVLADIGLQAFLPLFPYFHWQVVKEINREELRVLLDWV